MLHRLTRNSEISGQATDRPGALTRRLKTLRSNTMKRDCIRDSNRGMKTRHAALSAVEISVNVAFSASLTGTPPTPRNPPSFDASATCWLICCSHAL